MNKGIIIKSTGSWYHVKYDNKVIQCKLRGIFKTKGFRTTNPVAVGDYVGFEYQDDNIKGIIKKIYERKNFLVRKSTNLSKQSHIIAANIDFCFLVITLKKPVTYPVFIDRYLIACEANKIKAVLIFNKIDIYNKDETEKLKKIIAIYKNIGYKCIEISVKENINIDEVTKLIQNKTIVISGNSGVGKSSLINLLEPGLKLKTSEISDYHEQGKHTTTFAEMHKIGEAYIIDTPGIKGFGFVGINEENLNLFFPEMLKIKKHCKFNNCTHTHEPECAVKNAVGKKQISSLRYNNYLNILAGDEDKYRQDKYGI
ncbi:MAG: ribosome small subunit-dependent GTPase A [Bacteroidales bacterium]|nr:ribosome small subunit-dependent GTPase A [Bacteroidales bacterium]